jgi:NADPH:quinone reductase-like Zn-dependent oxidoreductase
VLVNAGAWPIGSAAIQLLKELGAVLMALGDEYLELE